MINETSRYLLIRDGSKLSEQAENFLAKNKLEYDFLYQNTDRDLPVIFDSTSRHPYKGEKGLKLFIGIYKEKQKISA